MASKNFVKAVKTGNRISKKLSKKNLFKKPKHRVSISSPEAFAASIERLQRHGLTKSEKKSIMIAQQRAYAQSLRGNLNTQERKQFSEIVNFKLPNVTSVLKARRRKKKKKTQEGFYI